MGRYVRSTEYGEQNNPQLDKIWVMNCLCIAGFGSVRCRCGDREIDFFSAGFERDLGRLSLRGPSFGIEGKVIFDVEEVVS